MSKGKLARHQFQQKRGHDQLSYAKPIIEHLRKINLATKIKTVETLKGTKDQAVVKESPLEPFGVS